MSDIRIPAPVIIQDAIDERSWHATLPNGKIITVYQKRSGSVPDVKTGDLCIAHLSLCDFDHGKIVAVKAEV